MQLDLIYLTIMSQSVTLGPQSAADKVQAEEEEEEKIPTKCIKTRELVSIRCAVEFIDYEGLGFNLFMR